MNINVIDLERSVAFYEALGFATAMRFSLTAEKAALTCAAFAVPHDVRWRELYELFCFRDPDGTLLEIVG